MRIRMSRQMIWGLFALLLSLPLSTKAQTTINAASCSSTDVQTALNKVAADNTTVIVPSCPTGVTWSTQVAYKQVFSTTIQGQTTCTGAPASLCTDSTVINDGVTGDNPSLLITTAAGKSFRLSGMTFQNNTFTPKYEGTLRVVGNSTQVRLDHLHFNNINVTSVRVNDIQGVMDHCVVNMGGDNWNGIKIGAPGISGFGNETWAASTSFGSSQFFFVEDSTFTRGLADDCDHGGRFVFRHNLLDAGVSALGGLQTHPTGGGGPDLRGCRAWEIYQNAYATTATPFDAMFASSGTGLFWGNTVPSGFQHILTLHSMRRNNNTYSEAAAPNGWGYCGTSFNGTGSPWDQNTVTSTGYACLDQPGRGKGDLLTGAAPNKINSTTGTIAWPHQALEPVYEWLTTGWTGTSTNYAAPYESDVLHSSTDYYVWCNALSASGCSTFSGTAGVGSGLLAARPNTCSPLVGYWATDTNTLYTCTAPNSWTNFYTPYTYPHPLVGSSGPPPAPPTALAAIVN